MPRPKYKQGIFNPRYPKKYTGTLPIVYRSKLELRFFRWLDTNHHVLEWKSESTVVPYVSPKDGRRHRYFVDNNVLLKDPAGKIHRYLVEVKPYRHTQPPKVTPKRNKTNVLREQLAYAVNKAKWQAARGWCAKNDTKFIIVTEKDLSAL